MRTHTCRCGREVWARYEGRKHAAYVGCCAPQVYAPHDSALSARSLL